MKWGRAPHPLRKVVIKLCELGGVVIKLGGVVGRLQEVGGTAGGSHCPTNPLRIFGIIIFILIQYKCNTIANTKI